jgi:hypothetical protein
VAGLFELFGYLSEHYTLQNVPAPLIWYFEFRKFHCVLLGFASDIFNLPKTAAVLSKTKHRPPKKKRTTWHCSE